MTKATLSEAVRAGKLEQFIAERANVGRLSS